MGLHTPGGPTWAGGVWEGPLEKVTSRLTPNGCPGIGGGVESGKKWSREGDLS